MLTERDMVLRFQALEARVTALEALVTAPPPAEVAVAVDTKSVEGAPALVDNATLEPAA